MTSNELAIDLHALDNETFSALADQVEVRLTTERQTRNALKHEKEKAQLLRELDAANYSTQRTRVAFLLNQFPDARDSDVTLTLRYWQTFQPDLYTSGCQIPPHMLFKLERSTTIARLRAKIQNDYGLFRGTEEVQRKRRQREEAFREDMATDKPSSRTVHVFVDETGKTADYVIVGSAWFLEPAKAAFFQVDVSKLAHSKQIKGEFHFADCKKSQLENYKLFIDIAAKYSAFLSFKAIVAKRSGTTRRADDAVKALFRLLIIKGFNEEVAASRLSLPRVLNVTIDQGSGLDAIERENMVQDISQVVANVHGASSAVERITEIESSESASIQLADLFCGAVNRRINSKLLDRNHKDEIADYFISKLAPSIEELDDQDSLSIIRLT